MIAQAPWLTPRVLTSCTPSSCSSTWLFDEVPGPVGKLVWQCFPLIPTVNLSVLRVCLHIKIDVQLWQEWGRFSLCSVEMVWLQCDTASGTVGTRSYAQSGFRTMLQFSYTGIIISSTKIKISTIILICFKCHSLTILWPTKWERKSLCAVHS